MYKKIIIQLTLVTPIIKYNLFWREYKLTHFIIKAHWCNLITINVNSKCFHQKCNYVQSVCSHSLLHYVKLIQFYFD